MNRQNDNALTLKCVTALNTVKYVCTCCIHLVKPVELNFFPDLVKPVELNFFPELIHKKYGASLLFVVHRSLITCIWQI